MKTDGTEHASAFLPLHEGLIVTTDGVEVGVASTEHDTDDVLRVTTVGARHATLAARIAEEADETVVITSGEESAVTGCAHRVDVSAIGAGGVDTLGVPSELDGLGGPCGAGGVGSARGILLAVGDGEEEELVGATVGADGCGSSAPVHSHDV